MKNAKQFDLLVKYYSISASLIVWSVSGICNALDCPVTNQTNLLNIVTLKQCSILA